MKLLILQEKLKEGLSLVGRISSKSLSLPILNNILIRAEKNFLNLSSTNLETGINWWAFAKVEKEGGITVPARLLSDFCGLLPNQPIELETKDLTLSLKCGNCQTLLNGLSVEDFPIIPQITQGLSFSVNGRSFCQGLSQVVEIASSSGARPEISGIYFSFQKDLIKMAATDSFRLGEKTLSASNAIEKECSIILPQKAAKEVINIFSEKEEIKIYLTANQISFESLMPETPHPQVHLVSRLIDGEYPNYQEIIPKKNEVQLIFQRNEFINQIKTASLFSGKINEIKLKINHQKGGVEFLSQNSEIGQYQSFLPGQVKGKTLEVSFNHRFLAEGLLSMKSAEVIFELNGEAGPAVLKPKGDISYLYVIMPIKNS